MAEPEGQIAPLREDLTFSPAPPENGAPVWMLFDPVNGCFLRADWAHFELLKYLDRPQTLPELLQRLNENTTLRLEPAEVRAFVHDLMLRNLLRSRLLRDAKEMHEECERSRLSPLRWFLHHYLYFRVPLFRPDAFLERTARYARLCVSRGALAVYVVFALCGLYLLSQHLDLYLQTVPDFLNWRGAFAFGVAIAGVKGVHEFAHAYAAKLLGNRVPTMGLAFIVLWPVPYCDVTDSWRMDSRRKRLLISSAGIFCELVLAAVALTLWGICESPIWKGLFFMLSSASLAGTLLVNLNPAMRFDGYYLLSDLLGIDNLYSRAGEYVKWRYRRSWFGIETPDPEPRAEARVRLLLSLYGVTSWVYRLFLYFGIALVVYHSFPKIIGIILFALEILLFILRPAVVEIRLLWRLRSQAQPRTVGLCIGGAAVLALLWAALPLSRYTGVPAVYEFTRTQIVYAPQSGTLRRVKAFNGKRVRAGDMLAVIESVELEQALAVARARAVGVQDELRRAMITSGEQARLRELTEQLAGARSEVRGFLRQREACVIRADVDGVISGWQDTAETGSVVGRRQELGLVAGQGAGRVRAYLPTELAAFTPQTGAARFVAASGADVLRVEISGISPVRERELRHSGLTTEYGGGLAVRSDKNGRALLQGSYFLLQAQVNSAAPTESAIAVKMQGSGGTRNGAVGETRQDAIGGGQTGTLWFWSRSRSYLAAQARSLWRVLLRESGL